MKTNYFSKLMVAVCCVFMCSCTAGFEPAVDGVGNALLFGENYGMTIVSDVKAESKSVCVDFNNLPVMDMAEIKSLAGKLNNVHMSESDKVVTSSDDTVEHYTVSVTGKVDNNNSLVCELDFIRYKDDGSLYYADSRMSVSGTDFYVTKTGFSLSTASQEAAVYNVLTTGTAYFKTVTDDNKVVVVKVPLSYKGTFNPSEDVCVLSPAG